MRKIEAQMVNAIRDCKSWKCDNTKVTVDSDGLSFVYLHGNKIAEIGEDFITLFDGGWRSVTTKSRLNAILNAFGSGFDGIFQKDFQWFFHDSARSVDVPFESGMTIA
jgi:hypothetical protein